jgi:hypothetical protein
MRTRAGARRDADGVGSAKKHRAKISGQFAARLTEMLESPAYRVLSVSAHRVLSRIEVELARHGGTDNGKLPVTFDNFESYGIERHAIAPAIRELVALGFIEITERGRGGNAEFRTPNKYRITYRDARGVEGDGSHEWRQVQSLQQALDLARAARKAPKKQRTSAEKPTEGQCGKTHRKARFPVRKTHTTVSVGKPALLSISRGESDTGSRSAPLRCAVASEPVAPSTEAPEPREASRGLAIPALKAIEPEAVPINDGKHASRALADLNARRGRT